MNYAPIALFIFDRPNHLRHALESLLKCEGFDASPVYVFADGSRSPVGDSAAADMRESLRKSISERRRVTDFLTQIKGWPNL